MIGSLSQYASAKATPSATTILSVTNPLGVMPKYVHIECDTDSAPFTSNGYVREAALTDSFGYCYTTNGSSGGLTGYVYSPVSDTPTAVNTFRITADVIEVYKGTGSITSRWETNTEYTIHVYA